MASNDFNSVATGNTGLRKPLHPMLKPTQQKLYAPNILEEPFPKHV